VDLICPDTPDVAAKRECHCFYSLPTVRGFDSKVKQDPPRRQFHPVAIDRPKTAQGDQVPPRHDSGRDAVRFIAEVQVRAILSLVSIQPRH
jgi:hypothetical protein